MRCTLVGTRPRIVKELPTSQTLCRPPAKPLGTLCPTYQPNALCRAVKITKVHKWASASRGRKVMERSTSAIRRDRSWPITLRTSRRITRSGVSSRSLWHCCATRVSNTIRDTCLDDSCAVPTGLGPPIYAYPALKGGAKIFRACGAASGGDRIGVDGPEIVSEKCLVGWPEPFVVQAPGRRPRNDWTCFLRKKSSHLM